VRYITYSTSTTLCYTNGHPNGGSITSINNYIYFDPAGTPHAFSGGLIQVVAPCTGQQVISFTATATDNSGLKLFAQASGSNTVTASNGTVFTPPHFGPGYGSITDPVHFQLPAAGQRPTSVMVDACGG
jgi:hypothetical protein